PGCWPAALLADVRRRKVPPAFRRNEPGNRMMSANVRYSDGGSRRNNDWAPLWLGVVLGVPAVEKGRHSSPPVHGPEEPLLQNQARQFFRGLSLLRCFLAKLPF